MRRLSAKRVLVALALAAALAGAVLGMRASTTPDPELLAVGRGEVAVRISGNGTLQARVPVTIAARVTAQVVALHADHGELVRRGQLLATLDDRDLAAKHAAAAAAREAVGRNAAVAQANLAKAQADLELSESKLHREAELGRAGFVSASSLDAAGLAVKSARAAVDSAAASLAARNAEALALAEEVRYAQTLRSHARLTAPMDALVIQRSAEVGSLVAPGTPVFRLVDPGSIWIAARIDESLVGRLAPGMPASIRLRSGSAHAGRIARISRQSDAATRELEVNVAFDTPPASFAIDQEAEVTIDAGRESGVSVPVAALRRVGDAVGVMVMRDGKAVFQPVRLGMSDGSNVLVLSGLEEGARIVAWNSR